MTYFDEIGNYMRDLISKYKDFDMEKKHPFEQKLLEDEKIEEKIFLEKK